MAFPGAQPLPIVSSGAAVVKPSVLAAWCVSAVGRLTPAADQPTWVPAVSHRFFCGSLFPCMPTDWEYHRIQSLGNTTPAHLVSCCPIKHHLHDTGSFVLNHEAVIFPAFIAVWGQTARVLSRPDVPPRSLHHPPRDFIPLELTECTAHHDWSTPGRRRLTIWDTGVTSLFASADSRVTCRSHHLLPLRSRSR